MAYFKLSSPTRVFEYPYDFHSHLGGILPVRSKDVPSLASWLAGPNEERGEQALFEQALRYMLESNPFDLLMQRADKTSYERGECTAENIYFASVLIAQRMRPSERIDSLPVTDPDLYRAAMQSVQSAMGSAGEDRRWMLALMRYFNGKIYSSNKFTPFDDAYKMRSSLVDRVRAGKDGEAKYIGWIVATLQYLQTQGIKHIQIPASASDIDALDAQVALFNRAQDTEYRVLVHTPSAYVNAQRFADELDALLKKLLNKNLEFTIGLDVLGVENRVANYEVLFDFLRKNQDALSKSLKDKRSRSVVVHIHNGEGASAAADHRSLIGYYLAYGDSAPGGDFYQSLAAYVGRCVHTATERRATESAGSRGASGYGMGIFSRLFDELFTSNSLTHRGCRLRRFDINGERSRELAAYNGKRSVMALSELLDAPVKKGEDGTWYQLLTADESPYSFRLGHDYYYRNFMAAKYPVIAFDTNLGSNAITGASGLFKSAESYRINKGFRHLDGYIDTDVLVAASNSVAYMFSDSLTQEQIEFFFDVSKLEGTMEAVLAKGGVIEAIHGYLQAALGPLARFVDKNDYQRYVRLVTGIVGASTQASVRYQAMTRVYAVFQNWRSYLLGADGQGVEHSDIQDEFVRMVLMVAYNLLPVGQTVLSTDTLFDLQGLLVLMAHCYWLDTVGEIREELSWATRNIEKLEGYQAPASVLSLQRGPVVQAS